MNKIYERLAMIAKALCRKLRTLGITRTARECLAYILALFSKRRNSNTAANSATPAKKWDKQIASHAGFPTNEKVKAMTEMIVNHIETRYEMRYNVLDERTELRKKGSGCDNFKPVDNYTFHSIVVDLRLAGCDSWDSNIEHVLASRFSQPYHPFRHYMQHLPQWDGTDRVAPLALRVSTSPLWAKCFRVWLRGMAAQWAGRSMPVSNQFSPILVSRQQGMRKSTFCRMLMPVTLRCYYTDKFDLTAQSSPEKKIYQYGLINMDEFDRYTERQMAKLKNLMQLGEMRLRKPYARFSNDEMRLASFIGTSNSTELLTDPTGSRRFFCQEVDSPIDCDTPIDHAQLFAQLLKEVDDGMPCHFNKEEEKEIQEHNRAYYVFSSIEDTLYKMYTPAAAGDESGKWITPTDMFDSLRRQYGNALRGTTVKSLSRALTMQGTIRRHTRRGTAFFIKEVRQEL